MKIWDYAVDNRPVIYILILIILLFGYGSYRSLPRELSPDITIPLVIVSTPYVGVSPVDMEGLVTQPLERGLKGLRDIKQISSVSKDGLSTIRVEFNTGVDIDDALRRVRDKVNSTRPQLPADILDPVISEVNISEFPIMYVNIGGKVGLARLKKVAEDLQDRIEAIPGVIRADLTGGLEPEVQVNVDVSRMNAYQVSFDDIAGAIRSENLSIPGGNIDTKDKNLLIRVPGEFKEVRPLEDIVVKIQGGKAIYLRDVAAVDYSFEDRQTYARLNDTEVVSLGVRKRAGENLVRIAGTVKQYVEEERAQLPSGITIELTNDQSVFINRMVKELENSMFTGMFLVVLTLFMFFGFKNSLLISTAIPLSMFIGFIVMSAFGITLNMVVLFSLILVLGIVVDDAIVVIENTYRHQQDYGHDPVRAAKAAPGEVFIPVLTSTVTTLSAFVPLLFWPGIVGEFMKFLPLTLIITLSASLFVAYVISPVQAAQWINYRKEIKKAKADLEHPHWYRKYNPLTFLYHEVDTKVFPWLQAQYVRTLSWTLSEEPFRTFRLAGKSLRISRRGFTILASNLLLLFSFIAFAFLNNGVEFFPNTEPSQVVATIETPPGTSLDVTNEIARLVEERLAGIPGRRDVEFVVASIGSSDDVFDYGGAGTSNKGRVAINFFEKAKRDQSTFATVEEVRKTTLGIPGADLRVQKQQMGPPVGAPVSIEISGEDYDQLARLSHTVRQAIKDIPGLVDLKDDYNVGRPEIEVVVNRERAGMFWTSTGQAASTLRAAISGIEASKYRVGEDEYKIRVRLREDQRASLSDLQNLRINFMNRRGQQLSIPLSAVADVRRTSGVGDIRRKDQKRVITVTGEVEGRVQSAVLNDVKQRLAGLDLPPRYGIKFTGSEEQQNESQAFLQNAFLITLMLVFMIMVMEFNSTRIPFVIMLSVILSLIGVMFGLLVTRTPFSIMMTGVGVVALAGIVVRNGIVLLDFVKHNLAEGRMDLKRALLEAGRVRLRPVLLTAAATVLAILPLATGIDFDWRAGHLILGAESAAFWRPMGVAIIFGLTISTFLTLVVVPTAYSFLEYWTNRFGEWIRRKTRRARNQPE